MVHTHPFNSPFSDITRVGQYQKGRTNLDFTGARDSEWQWHQLGHMQVCTSLQTDNHANTSPLSFLQAGCPSCHPTNSVKALKAHPGSPGKRAVKRVCVCVCVPCVYLYSTGICSVLCCNSALAVHVSDGVYYYYCYCYYYYYYS